MAPKPSPEGAKRPKACQRKIALITRSATRSIRMAAAAITLSNQRVTEVAAGSPARSQARRRIGPLAGPSGRLAGVTAADATPQALFARALAVTPGGVNSPVRAFRGVGGTPRFMARGHGPYLEDVDGVEYVDLV